MPGVEIDPTTSVAEQTKVANALDRSTTMFGQLMLDFK
jgi:hypothetical protein